jgi:urease accessory protein
MQRIAQILPAGGWSGRPIDQVVLDYDGRHRRRIVMTGEAGVDYLLDLPTARRLRDGDGLQLADGAIVRVTAQPEPLLEVRAASPQGLTRLAWHLGNRHLDAVLETDRILIRRDHVIAHMLEHLGAAVSEIEAPFDPEGGAYAEDHEH